MKLGIVIQHYDARNDVREFVDLLAKDQEVVLFGSASILETIETPLEKRTFRQRVRSSDLLWLQLFNFLGGLPASANNFLITELFKLSQLSPLHRAWAAARLRLRMRLPSVISFDFLVDRLKGSDITSVEDVDRFLVITELSNIPFLSRVFEAGKPVDAYVYSWDHACKHVRFSKRVNRWLVWHEGIAEDLLALQGIPRDRIQSVGATQLAYVKEYLERPEVRAPQLKERYIYYGCGVGHVAMAEQEARLIGFLADTLREIDPEVLLLVRPYPMLADTTFFKELRQRSNVRFDEEFCVGRTDRSLSRDDIFSRLNFQEHAQAFVHCGTTMGLEAAYLDTPVLFLDLSDFDYGVQAKDFLHLGKFIHQYHNERYMILTDYRNVITRVDNVSPVLASVLERPDRHLAYNRQIAKTISLRDLATVASLVVPHVEESTR